MRWPNRCRSNYRDDVAMSKRIKTKSRLWTEEELEILMGMDFWEERNWDRYVVG